MSGINADGSGDTPGDFLGETEAALNLGWSSRNKVVEWETLPNTDHDSTIWAVLLTTIMMLSPVVLRLGAPHHY